MLINKVSSFAADASKKAGNAILNNRPDGAKLSNGLRKVNNFLQGESYNPGRGAYYALMGGCVILPRLMQAREPDEFREILTRDVITVLTILFAMKGLKSGMCSAAQKSAGFTLVKDAVGKNATKLQRLGGYLNPEGGITALDSKEILARYSNIKDKESLVKIMGTVDKEGGDLAKMFSIEKRQGLFDKMREKVPFLKKAQKETPLYDAAVKMFGGDFSGKTNSELIDTVKNITADSKIAREGLEDIVGSGALYGGSLDIIENAGEEIKEGILNSKNNPITYFARNLASNFETLSLGITAGFLGFGLPKINEKLTMKKHLDKPGLNPKRASNPEGGCAHPDNTQKQTSGLIFTTIKKANSTAFQSFMGNA